MQGGHSAHVYPGNAAKVGWGGGRAHEGWSHGCVPGEAAVPGKDEEGLDGGTASESTTILSRGHRTCWARRPEGGLEGDEDGEFAQCQGERGRTDERLALLGRQVGSDMESWGRGASTRPVGGVDVGLGRGSRGGAGATCVVATVRSRRACTEQTPGPV